MRHIKKIQIVIYNHLCKWSLDFTFLFKEISKQTGALQCRCIIILRSKHTLTVEHRYDICEKLCSKSSINNWITLKEKKL